MNKGLKQKKREGKSSKAKQNKTKQSEAKPGKAKQNQAKQSKIQENLAFDPKMIKAKQGCYKRVRYELGIGNKIRKNYFILLHFQFSIKTSRL